jgi:hypothetical protein
MSAPNAGSLTLLEAWFRAAARTVAGLTLTPDQCERIADEIREGHVHATQPRHEGAD